MTGLGYAYATIKDEEGILSNLKLQLERFNDLQLSDKEFDAILNHLSKGNVFEKSKTLKDRFQSTRENGDVAYIRFFNDEDWSQNRFQGYQPGHPGTFVYEPL